MLVRNSGASNSPWSKVDPGALFGVNLDSPLTEPVLKGVEVLLEVKGCYGGVFVGRKQCSVIDKCKNGGGRMCGDIKGVYEVENR